MSEGIGSSEHGAHIKISGVAYGKAGDGTMHIMPQEFWEEVDRFALHLAKTEYREFLAGGGEIKLTTAMRVR